MYRLAPTLPGRSPRLAFESRPCLERLNRPATRQFSIASRTGQSNSCAAVTPAPTKVTSLVAQRASASASRNFSSTSERLAKGQSSRELLPQGPARTRFAPSPTGYLHLGSLRTALFNYLLAKRTGGQFLLRIEDTDQKRLVPDAEKRLCDDLRWAGIQWDEGPEVGGPYGPYKQSERTELYQKHAKELLESKAAYRCFCSTTPAAPVDADPSLVGTAIGGCQSDCASIPADQAAERGQNERFAVRFAKPEKAPSWSDLVYGKVSLESKKTLPQRAAVEGVILLKGDGTPTYHLANVIDDHYMEITHVIRGTEWMSSTPLHVALYNAFGWTPPAFAHVGLLTDKDQAKLSKRNFDTDISVLKTKHGILPEALANFLALLGWRNPTRDDVMHMDKLTELFDLKFTKGNSIVALEKLWYLQKHHAKQIIERAYNNPRPDPDFESLVDLIEPAARSTYYPNTPEVLTNGLRRYVKTILLTDEKTYENPTSYIERNKYFFTNLPAPAAAEDGEISNLHLYLAAYEVILHDRVVCANDALEQKVTSAAEIPDCISKLKTQFDNDQLQYDGKIIDAIVEHNAANHDNTNTLALKSVVDLVASNYAYVIDEVCNSRIPKDFEDPEKLAKTWKKELHRYLRERLCFGLPGPGSAHVMAVLGMQECYRRIHDVKAEAELAKLRAGQ